MKQNEPLPGSDEDLRAENGVFNLKLEMDHGMKGYASAGRETFAFPGAGNVQNELNVILRLLEKNGIIIHNPEGHDDLAFYRVITEEFLPMKFGDFGNGPFMPPVITWYGMPDP